MKNLNFILPVKIVIFAKAIRSRTVSKHELFPKGIKTLKESIWLSSYIF